MKSVISSMAAASALVIGIPAAAQVANGYQTQNGYQAPNGYQNPQTGNGVGAQGNLAARIGQLQTRVQSGVQSGAIDRAEAPRLRQQLRQLVQLERQYTANGLTSAERSELQQRLRDLRQQVRTADGGANGQYDQYDRDEGYGQVQGNQGQPPYGQPQYGQDVNGGYQQPVQPVQPRSGLGGIVDRVLGTGGLRVGQQATGNLYAVPNEYRNQYRDNNTSYYRSDGRQIYQIDARSQAVVQVYPLNR